MSHEETIRDTLTPFVRSEVRREQAAGDVYHKLEAAGVVLDSLPVTVEVPNSRVPVETVHLYGLAIQVDANGRAVSVHSPEGFDIAEHWKAV